MLFGLVINFLRLMTMMSASDGSTGSIRRLRVPTLYINLPNKRYLTLINIISEYSHSIHRITYNPVVSRGITKNSLFNKYFEKGISSKQKNDTRAQRLGKTKDY
jgi:hypothetical protein